MVMSSLPLECQKGREDKTDGTEPAHAKGSRCKLSRVRARGSGLACPKLLLGVCTPRNGGRSALIRDSLWEDLRHAVL
jgi:hypothetical protein